MCLNLKQIVDIIVQRLEKEHSLTHRLNLFYLVDSITQISRNVQGKFLISIFTIFGAIMR